jgi:hypothetical protein
VQLVKSTHVVPTQVSVPSQTLPERHGQPDVPARHPTQMLSALHCDPSWHPPAKHSQPSVPASQAPRLVQPPAEKAAAIIATKRTKL